MNYSSKLIFVLTISYILRRRKPLLSGPVLVEQPPLSHQPIGYRVALNSAIDGAHPSDFRSILFGAAKLSASSGKTLVYRPINKARNLLAIAYVRKSRMYASARLVTAVLRLEGTLPSRAQVRWDSPVRSYRLVVMF